MKNWTLLYKCFYDSTSKVFVQNKVQNPKKIFWQISVVSREWAYFEMNSLLLVKLKNVIFKEWLWQSVGLTSRGIFDSLIFALRCHGSCSNSSLHFAQNNSTKIETNLNWNDFELVSWFLLGTVEIKFSNQSLCCLNL